MISRHCEEPQATKQSSFLPVARKLDCFASLAMTVVLHPPSTLSPGPILAKAKQTLKWQRDPEGMRIRILEAAKQEFAAHGLAGARVDRIAAKAGANKRMLYYHVGKKDDLYLAVLEGAYEQIRAEERGLDLEHLDPPDAIERLIEFTWTYFIRNPEFLALLNTENLAKARHLKRSTKVKSMSTPPVQPR